CSSRGESSKSDSRAARVGLPKARTTRVAAPFPLWLAMWRRGMPLDKATRKRRNAKTGIGDAADRNAADCAQRSNPMEKARWLIHSGRVASPQEAALWSSSSGDFVDLCFELNRRDAEERRRLREEPWRWQAIKPRSRCSNRAGFLPRTSWDEP